MNMHARIMRIAECDRGLQKNPDICYRLGFGDARHAAAEIAAEGDALVEELAKALETCLRWMPSRKLIEDTGLHSGQFVLDIESARATLAKARP
jgi:hypothetical protein